MGNVRLFLRGSRGSGLGCEESDFVIFQCPDSTKDQS